MRKVIAIFIIAFHFFVQLPAQAMPTINELAARFKGARSEREKMEVCLDAIDNRCIELGCSVNRVDELFGTDFSTHLPPAGKVDLQGVHFSPKPETKSSPGEQVHDTTWPGWFLAVKFGSTGMVLNYYLTNCSKQI